MGSTGSIINCLHHFMNSLHVKTNVRAPGAYENEQHLYIYIKPIQYPGWGMRQGVAFGIGLGIGDGIGHGVVDRALDRVLDRVYIEYWIWH